MIGYLLVQPAPAPIIEFQPSAAQSADVKIRQFRRAAVSGRERPLQFNEAELNSWLAANLQTDREEAGGSAPSSSGTEVAGRGASEGAVERFLSTVREVRVKLMEDRLKAYVRFVVYGKLLSVELEGRLYAREGYLRLDPVAGRLCSLPLPGPPLAAAMDRLLQSPHNREAFRVPDYVRAIGVYEGRLLVNFPDGEL